MNRATRNMSGIQVALFGLFLFFLTTFPRTTLAVIAAIILYLYLSEPSKPPVPPKPVVVETLEHR